MAAEIDVNEYEHEMWTQVQRLRILKAEIDAREAQYDQQRAAATEAMRRYGAALSIEGQRVTRETVAELYWQNPDLYAQSIADAFTIEGGGSNVHRVAGAGHFEVACRGGCGTALRLASRTAKTPICVDCAAAGAERRAQQNAEWDEWRARKREEREQMLRDELRTKSAEAVYGEMVARHDPSDELEYVQRLEREMHGPSGGKPQKSV